MNRVEFPQCRCLAGVARAEITPPVGIYHRMWGAAAHDRCTGVHRPLTATVLYLANLNGDASPEDMRVVVALDHCLLGTREMNDFLDRVSSAAKVPRNAIVSFFSHTHAAGLMGLERQDLPGGDLIPKYLEDLATKVGTLVGRARETKRPASIAFAAGRCSMAANRDYFDERLEQFVCGFNPAGTTDDRVLVGRATDEGNRPVATVVNYACHPTTLAWENTLISPDYVGAMRELVEEATGAPCLFIQGASGDVGPRDGFVADVAVADRNGRQLGYAVLSTLESLPDPGVSYEYTGPLVSGATLGIWEYAPVSPRRKSELAIWLAQRFVLPLKYRDDLPEPEELLQERSQWEMREQEARSAGDTARAADARAMVERVTRRLTRIGQLPPGDSFPLPVQLWRMGDSVWIGLNGEHYNLLQRELRSRFPDVPIVVGTLANGSDVSYLLDEASYGKGLYQEKVSLLAKGCLETLIDAIAARIRKLTAAP
jgi:hypothetical protein